MNSKNWPKFPVLFSLYIAQSIPMSFFSTVIPVIMRQENYSLGSIGLLQLVKLPWIIKFLWAPLVDNHTASRRQIRQWIVISELFYAAIIVGIGFFDLKTDFVLIVVLIIAAFILSATQDIATDIFAIKVLKHNERSLGNSMQSAGSFVGSLFGTGVLLVVYHYFGWQNLLWALASFVVFALIPVLLYKPNISTSEEPKKKVKIMDVFLFFNNKVTFKHMLLLIFYYSALIGILAMLKPYLVDLGYNIKQIGFMSGIVGTSVAATCALLGGLVVKMIGRRASFYLFACFNIAVASYFFFLSKQVPTLTEIYAGICMLWGAYGLSTVIIYTSSMDKVRKNTEGSDFTIQIVVTHLSSLLVTIVCSRLGDKFGYNGMFATEILFGLIALSLVYYNYPLKRSKNEVV